MWAEHDVQRLWFEEAYHHDLTTSEGGSIRILQPGFWNHGPGPDFDYAALLNEKGEVETGSVEIHLKAKDWSQHHHDHDRGYEPVILHVVWEEGPRTFFPRTRSDRSIRQVVLSNQLRAPVGELRHAFAATPKEIEVGARLGACKAVLDGMKDRAVMTMLEEAGWFRFRQRTRLWQMRRQLVGDEQALWFGLADAMGYVRNRPAFQALAQILKVRDLHGLPDEKREALLFGVAGLIEGRVPPVAAATRAWLRSLWDEWWGLSSAWEGRLIPKSRWVFSGVRPANRPERRLGFLARVAERGRWGRLVEACRSGKGSDLSEAVTAIDHPFWEWHSTFRGRKLAKKQGLVGRSRVEQFAYNVVWPLFHGSEPDIVETEVRRARSSLSNLRSRRAAVRLLGDRKIRGLRSNLLAQEGLIQVYQDFCLEETHHCRQCEFPELAESLRS